MNKILLLVLCLVFWNPESGFGLDAKTNFSKNAGWQAGFENLKQPVATSVSISEKEPSALQKKTKFKKAEIWKEVRKQVKELKEAIRSSPEGKLSMTQIVLLVLATIGIAAALSVLFFIIAFIVGWFTEIRFFLILTLTVGLLSIIRLSIRMWKSAIRKAKRSAEKRLDDKAPKP